MLSISSSSTKKALIVLIWPLIQVLALRVYLHWWLQLRFGWVRTTDFDFLIPIPMAFIIFIQALERDTPLKLTWSRWATAINLAAMAGFIFLNRNFELLTAHHAEITMLAWAMLLGAIVVSAFSIFVSPIYYVKNANRFTALPCLLIGTAQYFYMNGFREWWCVFGTATANVIHFVFSNLPFGNITSSFSPEEAVQISHPLFLVRIGKGCGGLESLFFFTLLFLLIVSLHEKRIRPLDLMKMYLSGTVLMFALNLFRIISLFFVGIGMKMVLPHAVAIGIFKSVFHLNLGWILYAAGMYGFFRYFALRLSVERVPPTPSKSLRKLRRSPTT
jgi:exosortase/archaeosortase family protein